MGHPDRSVSRHRHAETLLILAALLLMAYANSFGGEFVLDSGPLILHDARVHTVSLHNLKEVVAHSYWWPQLESGLYRPLTTSSYLFNYAVLDGRDRPLGYHCVNFLLHAANAFLIYLLSLHLARQHWPAFFAAALWALHPIATEAVTNIVGRADELAALGVLGALLLHIRSTRETGRGKARWLAAMALATTLAVFSKESGVTAVALILLYDFTWRIPRGSSLGTVATRARQFFWEGYLFLAVPVLAMLGARWAVLRHSGAMEIPFGDNPLLGADLLTRWGTAIRVVGKYLGLLAWPGTLSIDYSYNQIPLFNWRSANWREAAAAAAVLGLLLLAIYCYRRSRAGFFLIGFSAIALLPATNLLVITGTIMAERLLYLPAAGFAIAVALGAYRLCGRLHWRPVVAAVALGAIGTAYGARTYRRNSDWKDSDTLFASAVDAAPDSYKTHMGLADALAVRDPRFLNGERAIDEAEKAAAIVNNLPDGRISTAVFVTLSALYWARGDSLAHHDADGNPILDSANSEWYHKALEAALRGVAVDRAQNQNHRQAELARGTPPAAIGLVGMPGAYLNLGTAYLRLGDVPRALDAFLYERRLAPALPSAYANLASACLARNKAEEAATFLLESLVLRESPPTLSRLAQLYGRIEGGACAIAGHGEDRSLNRDCPIVRHDLCNGYRDLAAAFRAAKLGKEADRILDARARDSVCQ